METITFDPLAQTKKELIGNDLCVMIEFLKGRVLEEWHLGGDVDKIYNVYQYEVLGVIEVWSKQKFATKQLDFVLSDILYLTNAARRNLLPLQ